MEARVWQSVQIQHHTDRIVHIMEATVWQSVQIQHHTDRIVHINSNFILNSNHILNCNPFLYYNLIFNPILYYNRIWQSVQIQHPTDRIVHIMEATVCTDPTSHRQDSTYHGSQSLHLRTHCLLENTEFHTVLEKSKVQTK